VSQIDKPRVLVVDGDESQCSAMSQLLGGWGYEAATARDGCDALDKLADWPADVVTGLN